MILYSKSALPIQMKNVMALDDPTSGGVVYVSKATYDQATILWSRFEGNASTLMSILKVDSAAMKALPGRWEALAAVCKNAPKPLDILGPFMKYIANNNNLNWADATMETFYGWLHQMSQMLDFNALTLVPVEVQAKVDIPSVILNSYEDSWKDLTESLKDKILINGYESVSVTAPILNIQPAAPITPTPAQPVTSTPVVNTTPVTAPEADTPTAGEDDFDSQLGDGSFDFAALIDPDYEPQTMIAASDDDDDKSKSGSSGNSDYAKKANSLLDDFDDMD